MKANGRRSSLGRSSAGEEPSIRGWRGWTRSAGDARAGREQEANGKPGLGPGPATRLMRLYLIGQIGYTSARLPVSRDRLHLPPFPFYSGAGLADEDKLGRQPGK